MTAIDEQFDTKQTLAAIAEHQLLGNQFAADLKLAQQLARTKAGRTLRQASGFTQTEVARAIGVSPSAMCLWEEGNRRPSGVPAVAWVRFLRTSTDPDLGSTPAAKRASVIRLLFGHECEGQPLTS